MKFVLLLLLVGCSTLTEQQRAERAIQIAEHEPDRVEKWTVYEYFCKESGIMLWHNPVKRCRRQGCIPHRMDWDFYYRVEDANRPPGTPDWKPKLGNNVKCISRRLF